MPSVTSHGDDPDVLTSMTQGPETGSGHSTMVSGVFNGASAGAAVESGARGAW